MRIPTPQPDAIREIGPYRLEVKLGASDMAVVYRAFDPVVDRTIALKVLRIPSLAAEDEIREARLRFESEVQTLSRLSPHDNIPILYHFGEHGQFRFFAMELIPGESLDHQLADGRTLYPDTAAATIRQIARALDHAHSKGIVHRDVKAHNVLVQPDGRVKVIDFGIARVGSQNLTATGVRLGTPAYMSPEQIRGESVGPLTDQFSLAALTYRMLTGRMPFDGQDETAHYNILHSAPRTPSSIKPSLPRGLDEVLLRALNKTQSSRFETCGAFADALDRVLLTTAVLETGNTTRRISSPLRRPSLLLKAVLISITCLAVAAGLTRFVWTNIGPNRAVATAEVRSAPPLQQPHSIDVPSTNSTSQSSARPGAPRDSVPANSRAVPGKYEPSKGKTELTTYVVEKTPAHIVEKSPVDLPAGLKAQSSTPAVMRASLPKPFIPEFRTPGGGTIKTDSSSAPNNPSPVTAPPSYAPANLESNKNHDPLIAANISNGIGTTGLSGGSEGASKTESHVESAPPVSRPSLPALPVANAAPTLPWWVDAGTGLMWTLRDNGSDVTWNQATSYCETVSLNGIGEWRLPEIGELEKIYDPARPNHVKSAIHLSQPWVWSATTSFSAHPFRDGYLHGFSLGTYRPETQKGTYFYFETGKKDNFSLDTKVNLRALCVRRVR